MTPARRWRRRPTGRRLILPVGLVRTSPLTGTSRSESTRPRHRSMFARRKPHADRVRRLEETQRASPGSRSDLVTMTGNEDRVDHRPQSGPASLPRGSTSQIRPSGTPSTRDIGTPVWDASRSLHDRSAKRGPRSTSVSCPFASRSEWHIRDTTGPRRVGRAGQSALSLRRRSSAPRGQVRPFE